MLKKSQAFKFLFVFIFVFVADFGFQLYAAEPDYWWYKSPTYTDLSIFTNVPSRVVQGNFGADFAWGQYAQRLSIRNTKSDINVTKAISPTVKFMSYIEGLGQSELYTAGFKTSNGVFPVYSDETDLVIINNNAWSWTVNSLTNVNFRSWIGPHNSVNNDEFVKPSCTQDTLRLPVPTYPDGTSAVGYTNNGIFPLNAKFFDATSVKDINDSIPRDYENIIDITSNPQVLRPMLYKAIVGGYCLKSYPNKVIGDSIFSGNIKVSKDPACPYWVDYHRISARTMLKSGNIDGIWTDNCSPFNNFSGPYELFGVWSEYKFNLYLQAKYSEQELVNMGISNISTFNIRAYMKQKAGALGATTAQKNDPNAAIYLNTGWYTDKVWNAYKVFKQKVGAEFLMNHYRVFKEEAAKVGKPDFAVGGNDIPMLNTGWVRDDYMDIICTEISMDNSQTINYLGGMGFPPLGKYAPIFRAALEHQKGPYSMVWFYGPNKTNTAEGLSKVLLSEAFANSTFVKSASNTCAAAAAHQWLNAFAEREESKFGRRFINADIGLLFSQNNYFAMALPGSMIPDKNYQPHRQDYLGFATALIDAHLPFRALTDWKVNAVNLSSFKTFIMPSTDYLNDSILGILTKWVEDGGRLVLTGSPGKFYDTDGLFQRRTNPLLQNLVGRDISNAPEIVKNDALVYDKTVYTRTVGKGTILWTAEPVGMNYFNAKYSADAVSRRASYLQNLKTMFSVSNLFDGSALPVTVGSYLWKSADENSVFVDLVNYNYDVVTDQILNEQNLIVKLKISTEKIVNSVIGISPEANNTLNYSMANGWVTITIPSLQNYLSVKLTTTDLTILENATINENDVLIVPNPAINEVRFITDNKIQSVKVYNYTGQLNLQKQLSENGILNIVDLSSGVYSLCVNFIDKSYVVKKIIKK